MSDSPIDAEDFYEFANQFLKKNTHLFTIFGIFGAISVYLGTVTTELSANIPDIVLDVGIFTSLSLFTLVGLLINTDYKDESEEFQGIMILYPRKENIIPVFPIALFDALLSSVLALVVATLWESRVNLLALILSGIAFYATFLLVTYIARQLDEFEQSPFENVMYWSALFLSIFHILLWIFIRNFIYPSLSNNAYQLTSNVVLAIGVALILIISIILIYDIE